MGEYADVKRAKILKLLKWLDKMEGFTVDTGGNHQWVIKYTDWNRPYPIPFKHNVVKKTIVKALMKKVVATNLCTKEEFDQRLK